jgi:hypothetical protein
LISEKWLYLFTDRGEFSNLADSEGPVLAISGETLTSAFVGAMSAATCHQFENGILRLIVELKHDEWMSTLPVLPRIADPPVLPCLYQMLLKLRSTGGDNFGSAPPRHHHAHPQPKER